MPRKGKFATQVTRCSNFVASVGWDNVQIAQKCALELTLDHLKFDIFSEILLSLAIKVPRPLYNFPQSLFFVLLWLRVAFIQNNVFWLHHFGTKAILSFWATQTISSSLVVSASIAVIVLSVVVFSISVPPMVLISEELINSWLGKKYLLSFRQLLWFESESASFEGCVLDWKHWHTEFKSACWAWRTNLRFATSAFICSECTG